MSDINTQIKGLSESIKSKLKKAFGPPKETFDDLESGLQNTIVSQNQLIDQQIDEFHRNINTMNQRHHYQTKMFHNLEFLNVGLFFIYVLAFIFVAVLILEQHYNQTVTRNKWYDLIVIALFLLYPFLIYSIEMYLYDFVMKIVSYFYGISRVPEFDDLLTRTDFYKDPSPNQNDMRDMRNKFT